MLLTVVQGTNQGVGVFAQTHEQLEGTLSGTINKIKPGHKPSGSDYLPVQPESRVRLRRSEEPSTRSNQDTNLLGLTTFLFRVKDVLMFLSVLTSPEV